MGGDRPAADSLQIVGHPVKRAQQLERAGRRPAEILEPNSPALRQSQLALQGIRTNERSRADVLANDALRGPHVVGSGDTDGQAMSPRSSLGPSVAGWRRLRSPASPRSRASNAATSYAADQDPAPRRDSICAG